MMRGARDAWLRSKDQDAAIQAWTWLAEPADTPATAGSRNALAGVGFGVKDVIDVAGMPTRSGSLATSPEPARWDASCVAQLRAAGAIPIGKTVTAEFAYAAPGPTRNPTMPCTRRADRPADRRQRWRPAWSISRWVRKRADQ